MKQSERRALKCRAGCRADCGWTDACDPQILAPLAAVAPRVDAVLLSHGDIAHLGALPAAFTRCGLRRGTPVCATTPVAKMGQLTLYDLFAARHSEGDFDAFTLDDVDAAFSGVQQLKYTQTLTLARPDSAATAVSVAPFAAGHTLGGALWRITAGAEEVVYAVDWNNRGERHLPPAALSAFARPSLLITDAACALTPPPPPRRDVERALCEACVACLRSDGCALLPCDAAGRTLEVVLALEAHWAANPGLGAYRVVLLTACAHSTLEFAANQLEWMSDAVARGFERSRDNAFALRHVTPVSSLDALDALPPGPKVVLASLASLAAGPARSLLARWAADPRCMLLFTAAGQEETLARALAAAAPIPPAVRPPLRLALGRRVLLQGEELAEWREQRRVEAEAKEEAAAAAALQDERSRAQQQQQQHSTGAEELAPTDAQPDSATGMDVALAGDTGAGDVDAEAAALCLSRHPCLVDGFALPAGAVAPMFPFEERVPQLSDYGEVVHAHDFAEGVEGLEGSVGAAAMTNENDMAAERLTLPAAPGADGMETPSKVVVTEVSLSLACVIAVVNISGRADGRSVRNTLAMMEPRRVVLVHGDADATSALAEHAAAALPGLAAPVAAPRAGERCDMSAATPSLRVRLGDDAADALAAALTPAGDGTYAVAWLDGVVRAPTAAAPAAGALRLLCAPQPGEAPRPHRAAFVGDLRFSDLLQACSAAGIPAQFSAGGVLLCGRGVSVRKLDGADGELLLEGTLGEDYYRVRDVLYARYRVM